MEFKNDTVASNLQIKAIARVLSRHVFTDSVLLPHKKITFARLERNVSTEQYIVRNEHVRVFPQKEVPSLALDQ